MTRIIISVINDLVTDQRVDRICSSLHKNGYAVLLVGRKLPWSQDIVRNYETHRMKLLFKKGFLFYTFFNIRLFLFLFFKKCDILLANDLDTLPANFLISKLKNKKLVFDSHEYFPEVPELIDRKKVQSVWLRIEKWIIPKLKYAYTVSPSIAKLYQEKYNVQFHVIRNLPYRNANIDTKKYNVKTIVYQGALNIGRGIELLIEAMKFLPEYNLKIAGDGDITQNLKALTRNLKLIERVEFLGRLTKDALEPITQKALLGVSLEEDRGLNYQYALPNKLFDYIQAEIPVIVSDLPEMKNIIKKYKVGEILEDRDPQKLAGLIRKIIDDKDEYQKYCNKSKQAAIELCWENEEEKLIELFNLI